MKFTATRKSLKLLKSDCAVVPLFKSSKPASYRELDAVSSGTLDKAVRQAQFSGGYKKALLVTLPDCHHKNVIVIGCGERTKLTRARCVSLAETCGSAVAKFNPKQTLYCFADLGIKGATPAWVLRTLALGLAKSLYQYRATFKKMPPKKRLTQGYFQTRAKTAEAKTALDTALAIADGITVTRNLANLPGNICTPAYLAREARKLSKLSRKISVKALEESTLKRLNMGAFLSVSQGSANPGKLVCIEYKNAPKRGQAPVALVGKGITFDTGGISIKPSATMDEMKFDMSGAASVVGALTACAKLKLPLNVIGILACAENMPGGKASKPGDIVTTMSGQTVEILNTDAEGRLVLCDALTYVQKRYKPDCIVDVATLTGACVVALGQEASGLMSNHQPLAQTLLKAGENAGDRAWQLPMWEDYQPQLHSNFADMANIGGRWAGTITAACFLSRFTEDCHWAHLDVAGTAWKTGAAKGSTGRPVPLLVEFLLERAHS